ncbi:ATP-dependent Clp protease proteolytic subunit [Clostridium perfringens]|uniref:ATP-dependent Clp protease proteolytic subunit n=1 Tax=Clostridium perfringens TaxID=1502 RepID=UPI0039EBA3A4
MSNIPYVMNSGENGVIMSDIYSKLLRDRIIFLTGEINDEVAMTVVAQLLLLESEDRNSDIYMYINSSGGSVSAGLAIIDTMKYINPKVVTIDIGMCASIGAIVLSQGDLRMALPNSEIMLHQPYGNINGQATNIAIYANRIQKNKERIINMLAKVTGKGYKCVEMDIERDFFMSSIEALEYGIIDKVIGE